jgi:hypothetical protein
VPTQATLILVFFELFQVSTAAPELPVHVDDEVLVPPVPSTPVLLVQVVLVLPVPVPVLVLGATPTSTGTSTVPVVPAHRTSTSRS